MERVKALDKRRRRKTEGDIEGCFEATNMQSKTRVDHSFFLGKSGATRVQRWAGQAAAMKTEGHACNKRSQMVLSKLYSRLSAFQRCSFSSTVSSHRCPRRKGKDRDKNLRRGWSFRLQGADIPNYCEELLRWWASVGKPWISWPVVGQEPDSKLKAAPRKCVGLGTAALKLLLGCWDHLVDLTSCHIEVEIETLQWPEDLSRSFI